MTKKMISNQFTIKRITLAFLFMLLFLFAFAACGSEEDEVSEPAPVDTSIFPEGTTLGGENISGKTVDEAITAGRAYLDNKLEELEISVKFKDDTIALKGDDFVYKDVLELYLQNILSDYKAGDYEIAYVTDLSAKGKEKIFNAAKDCYVEGKNATVASYDSDSGDFVFTEGENGNRADIASTMKNIRQLLTQKHGGALQAAFMDVTPSLSKTELSENFTKLATYSTVSSNTENGNHNMQLSLSRVNGTVLQPGDSFSFNGIVGDSTSEATGFKAAGGISGGVLVQMYGGGICQASTTIYGAAIRAGLEITMRECHSMESSYCPTGLDATVDYGNIDFQFRNNMDYPIYIAGWMEGVTLYVSIYGVQPDWWDTIEPYSERVGTYPPLNEVTFTEDVSLAKGEYQLKSSGNTGVESVASRTYYKNGEAVYTESLPSSYYRPTGKIYIVGPGTDTSKVDTSKSSGSTEPPVSASPTVSPTAPPAATNAPEPTTAPTPQPTEVPPVDTSEPSGAEG